MLGCVRLCDPTDSSLPGSSVHGIPRQRYWSGLPFLPPGDLPDPGIKPRSPASPALAGGFFATWATREALVQLCPNFSRGPAFTISAMSLCCLNYLLLIIWFELSQLFFFFLLKYIFKENFKSLLYPSVEQSHLQGFIWKVHLQGYENARAQGIHHGIIGDCKILETT